MSERFLTEGEKQLARSIFGNSINYDAVKIFSGTGSALVETAWAFGGLFSEPSVMAPDGNIYYPSDHVRYSVDFASAEINAKATFIHEMTHVWQHQLGVDVVSQGMSDRVYAYNISEGAKFSDFGLEQQAQIMRDYFLRKNGFSTEGAATLEDLERIVPADLTDPGNAPRSPTLEEQFSPDNLCFAAGTPIEMADGTTKPIEDIRLGDKVLAFDPDAEGGRGIKVAKRVTQLHRNENQPLINFHGTKVTPGHAYLTGEGTFLPIIEILQNDGTVVMSGGRVIRARTGWPVDSREDKLIPIGYPEGGAIKLTTMRAGTLYGGKDGRAYTIEQMMNSRGYHMMSDGRFIGVEGDIKTAYWEWGVPDDKMIAGKYAAYADLVEGSAIGMPLVPSRPN